MGDAEVIEDLMNMLPQKGKRKNLSKLCGSSSAKQKKCVQITELNSSSDSEIEIVENNSRHRKNNDDSSSAKEMLSSKLPIPKITSSNILIDLSIIPILESTSAISDSIDKQAAELCQRFTAAKEKLKSSDSVTASVYEERSQSSRGRVIIPKIMTAEERMKEASKLQSQHTMAVKSTMDVEKETPAGTDLTCSVRLNGHYSSIWKISVSDSFGKVFVSQNSFSYELILILRCPPALVSQHGGRLLRSAALGAEVQVRRGHFEGLGHLQVCRN